MPLKTFKRISDKSRLLKELVDYSTQCVSTMSALLLTILKKEIADGRYRGIFADPSLVD